MTSVLDGKTGLETTYDYDPARRVTVQAHPNGATTYFSYDLGGRLAEKVTKKNSDSSVLVRFAYTRDPAGNPISIERESGLGVFYYQYDALQRLAYEGQFVDAERAYENYYQYDPAGNRSLLRHGETGAENLTYYEYNEANELLTAHDKDGWTYFACDLNGNTLQEQKPAYTGYFDWDGRDMMVGVRSTEGGWIDNVYRYDGLASRVSTLESIGLTYYDWDGINVIQEKDEAGDVTDRQIHGYAPIMSVGDIALMDKAGASVYVPLADQVGTVWNLLDSSAAKANSYAYDAFGVAISVSESMLNRYRFGTKRFEDDSDLYHFIWRQYRPALGCFDARDPLGMALGQDHGGLYGMFSHQDPWHAGLGLSFYVYTQGRPTTGVDPLGAVRVLPPGVPYPPGLPYPGHMVVSEDPSGLSITANYADDCCDEINFIQWCYDDFFGNTNWRNDWGGSDPTPNPPFYVPHPGSGKGGHGVVESGGKGGQSYMVDAPGVYLGTYWKYITCAVCAKGESFGTFYGCVKWQVGTHWFSIHDYTGTLWYSYEIGVGDALKEVGGGDWLWHLMFRREAIGNMVEMVKFGAG